MVDRLDARLCRLGVTTSPIPSCSLSWWVLTYERPVVTRLNLRFDPAAMTVAEGSDDDQPDQMLRQIMCVPGRRARHEWTAQWAAFRADGRGLDLRCVRRR